MELPYQFKISGSSHQFYLPVEHHAIHKEYKEYEGEYEEYVDENQDEFLD